MRIIVLILLMARLPAQGQVFFAIETMTFRAFAQLFISKGCSQAHYLDGAVSKVWTPGKDTYSDFGVMIGVEK